MKIVINGVGVAGPALGYWLTKAGHEVVLVEEAPRLRAGGYIIDFWGIGYDIAEEMGLIGEIRRLGYQVREVRFVGRDGRKRGGFDLTVFGRMTHDRFTSVPRSDVSATVYRAIEGRVEAIFGDSVAGIDEHDNGVRVTFDHARSCDADLVIGADGLHSRVRRLAFGADSEFITSLGYHVAAFEVEGYRPRDELVYVSHGLPGRQVSRFAMRDDKTLFLFVFRDEYIRDGQPKSILCEVFAGSGCRWTRGRTALVGDAAACVSLMAGEGLDWPSRRHTSSPVSFMRAETISAPPSRAMSSG
jgi:2-polyprenyl-6-methoxyphenol hydroxylase-like FAD-dependent oxidoreductase